MAEANSGVSWCDNRQNNSVTFFDAKHARSQKGTFHLISDVRRERDVPVGSESGTVICGTLRAMALHGVLWELHQAPQFPVQVFRPLRTASVAALHSEETARRHGFADDTHREFK